MTLTEDGDGRPSGQEHSDVLCAEGCGLGFCGDDIDDRSYGGKQVCGYDRTGSNERR